MLVSGAWPRRSSTAWMTRPGFYRWHLLDPIVFERDLRVTIQQIGSAFFGLGRAADLEGLRADQPTSR